PLLTLLEPGEVLRVSLGAGLISVFTEFDAMTVSNLEAEAYRRQGAISEREKILAIIDEVMPKGLLYNGYTMALKARITGAR
ncbi:hypothetical protein, partial [Raoultella ornithinolytica]|uniref:hypothetical protein n=1 Tax=Raoultella ornithinolytica TaxID=54291 RepID=UPI00384DF0FC